MASLLNPRDGNTWLSFPEAWGPESLVSLISPELVSHECARATHPHPRHAQALSFTHTTALPKQDSLNGARLSVCGRCPAPRRAVGKGAAWCRLEGTPQLFAHAPPALHFHHFSHAFSLATRHPTDPAPAHCPSPRASVFFNLLSEGPHLLFCLYTGTRAHLTRREGATVT